MSDQEKEDFLHYRIMPYVYHMHVMGHSLDSPKMLDMQYDLALLTKGLRLLSSNNTIKYILQQKDSISLESYYQLKVIHRRLARQFQLEKDKREEITKLETEKERLEKVIARASASFRKDRTASKITQKKLKSYLRPKDASIEFIQYNYQNPDPTDSTLYAACILLPDTNHVHFIPLFEEKKLNALFKKFDSNQQDYYTNLYTSRGLTPKKKQKLSTDLYQIIWQPLDSLLKGVETIYYSPSGLLNRLNLAAIPINEKQTMGDKYNLYQLSSTRELALGELTDSTTYQNDALLVGGIEYDIETEQVKIDTSETRIVAAVIIAPPNEQRGKVSRGDKWTYLPGTQKEAITIHHMLEKAGYDSQLLNNKLATEEHIKKIGVNNKSPRILHFATHGFFFPDPVDTLKHRLGEPVYKFADNPMLRSGLILAGANRAWQGASPIPDKEDGILTAYEIANMNLTNTELVVLSACETGLGDIKGSEGVFGLQRAFKKAGVRYLIMSLWQVPDKQTQELMTLFYSKWLEEKIPIPDAFNAAQQEIREQYPNPYFWAGFVLME